MEERISTNLKGQQFFDLGTIIFASNHPDHVFLLEIKNNNDEKFTVLYDKKHDYLNIHKNVEINDENVEDHHMELLNIELTVEQQNEIKLLLETNANNVEE